MDLGVGAELEHRAAAVRTGLASDDIVGAGVLQDRIAGAWQTVEVLGGESKKMADDGARKASVRHAADGGAGVFFHGPDGPLDFRDMAIGRDNVEMNVGEVGSETVEFVVGVDGADVEAASLVLIDDGSKMSRHLTMFL